MRLWQKKIQLRWPKGDVFGVETTAGDRRFVLHCVGCLDWPKRVVGIEYASGNVAVPHLARGGIYGALWLPLITLRREVVGTTTNTSYLHKSKQHQP